MTLIEEIRTALAVRRTELEILLFRAKHYPDQFLQEVKAHEMTDAQQALLIVKMNAEEFNQAMQKLCAAFDQLAKTCKAESPEQTKGVIEK